MPSNPGIVARVTRTESALAPSDRVFRFATQYPHSDTWKGAYLQELRERTDLQKIINRLEDGAVLLCWEHDCNRCHRLLAAKVLSDHGCVYAGEYKAPGEPEQKRHGDPDMRDAQPKTRRRRNSDQPSLFDV